MTFTVHLDGQSDSSIDPVTQDIHAWAWGDGSGLVGRARVRGGAERTDLALDGDDQSPVGKVNQARRKRSRKARMSKSTNILTRGV